MRKQTKNLIIASTIAILVTLLAGCDGFLIDPEIEYSSPTGEIFDVKAKGDTIYNATVTLTSKENKSTVYRAYTTSLGKYNFNNIPSGKYELTATKTNYVFIKEIVTVAGSSPKLPKIGGFLSTDLVSGTVSIITFWDEDFDDVDVHLTFPNTPVGTVGFADGDFYTPVSNNSKEGFFPEVTIKRDHIDWTNKTSTSSDANIIQDVDNTTGGGPETITIKYTPILAKYNNLNSYHSNGSTDVSGLPEGDYSAVGVMEFYLDAFYADKKLSSSDNINTADPKVYIFAGENQIASYSLPTYTTVTRASIFRINIFNSSEDYDYMQIIADTRILNNEYTIRGIDSVAPIVIKGTRR